MTKKFLEPMVNSHCDQFAHVRLSAFEQLRTGYPLWIVAQHEETHKELQQFSASGLFQFLLASIERRRAGSEHELNILARAQRDLVCHSSLVHEGLSVYCTALNILLRSPQYLNKYLNSLPRAHQRAFRMVSSLLPRPTPLSGDVVLAQTHRTVAVLLGIYLCSPPILTEYRNKEVFFSAPCRYISEDTADDKLQLHLEQPDDLKAVLIDMFKRVRKDAEEMHAKAITYADPGQQFRDAQRRWPSWLASFTKALNEASIWSIQLSTSILHKEFARTVNRWDPSGENIRISSEREQTKLHSGIEVTFPCLTNVTVRKTLSDRGQIKRFIAAPIKTKHQRLIVVAEQHNENRSYTTEYKIVEGQIKIHSKSTDDIVSAYVLDLPESKEVYLYSEIECTELVIDMATLSECSRTSKTQLNWVVEGIPYIRRQLAASQIPQEPPDIAVLSEAWQEHLKNCTLPVAWQEHLENCTLWFKTVDELLSAVPTILPKWRPFLRYTVIATEPRMLTMSVGSECMFAFAADSMAESVFRAGMYSENVPSLSNSEVDGSHLIPSIALTGGLVLSWHVAKHKRGRNEHD